MLLIKNIRQVLTLREGNIPRRGADMGKLGVIENGAILVRGERIEWVGPTKEIPAAGAATEAVDGLGLELVALPGFVDGHTHPVFAGTRAAEYEMRSLGKTYQEIARAGGGIRASVQQVRAASLEQLVDRTERYFRRFLEHGTTTIEAKSGYGLSLEDELKLLRALAQVRQHSRLEAVPTLLGAHDVPDEYRGKREEYIRLIIEKMIPAVAEEKLAQYCDVFCDAGYFTPEEGRTILQAAKDSGLGLRVHAEELAHTGAAAMAADMGADSADHLEWIDDSGLDALRRAGTVAMLLPGTAFNLGLKRYPPARRMIDAGVPVALATDFNPGSSFTLNMQLILSIACSQMKMTPAEAIAAATVNGAFSLGLSERLGTLEQGKQADIVLMDVADFREIPYFFGINHCVMTIKKGHIVVDRLERM